MKSLAMRYLRLLLGVAVKAFSIRYDAAFVGAVAVETVRLASEGCVTGGKSAG